MVVANRLQRAGHHDILLMLMCNNLCCCRFSAKGKLHLWQKPTDCSGQVMKFYISVVTYEMLLTTGAK